MEGHCLLFDGELVYLFQGRLREIEISWSDIIIDVILRDRTRDVASVTLRGLFTSRFEKRAEMMRKEHKRLRYYVNDA